MRRDEIIESFRRRGILKYVERYREIRDKLESKLESLKRLGVDVGRYEDRFNMLKKRGVDSAKLIKKGDEKFIERISSIIRDLNNLYNSLRMVEDEWINIGEKVSRLKAFYNNSVKTYLGIKGLERMDVETLGLMKNIGEKLIEIYDEIIYLSRNPLPENINRIEYRIREINSEIKRLT